MCAKRRMLSVQIIDTDAFLEMPLSAQALYFHLVMRADDEGFIGNSQTILRLVGCKSDDMKILIAKRFVLTFKSGVVVIKHWLIHNTIRMDRFQKTAYQEEKKSLVLKDNKSYTDNCLPTGNQLATNWQPKLSKVKLSKVKLREDREEITPHKIAEEFFNNKDYRDKKINELLEKYSGIGENIINIEISKFILYWTELNRTGKKQRWEMEKTFEVDRRLATWFLRSTQFNQINKRTITSI